MNCSAEVARTNEQVQVDVRAKVRRSIEALDQGRALHHGEGHSFVREARVHQSQVAQRPHVSRRSSPHCVIDHRDRHVRDLCATTHPALDAVQLRCLRQVLRNAVRISLPAAWASAGGEGLDQPGRGAPADARAAAARRTRPLPHGLRVGRRGRAARPNARSPLFLTCETTREHGIYGVWRRPPCHFR